MAPSTAKQQSNASLLRKVYAHNTQDRPKTHKIVVAPDGLSMHCATCELWAPKRFSSAFFKELCGSKPGYEAVELPRASFQRDRVSLPPVGIDFADGEKLLAGRDLDSWKKWRSRMLRATCRSISSKSMLGSSFPRPPKLNKPDLEVVVCFGSHHKTQ